MAETVNNKNIQLVSDAAIEQIREKVREMLDSGKIECFIGYEKSDDGTNVRPAFIYDSADVGRLVFDSDCYHNLTKYLLNFKGKPTGILVKPCDSKAINLLISEKQIQRDDIVILGAVCAGIPQSYDDKGSNTLKATCYNCSMHMPVVYDVLIGEPMEDEEIKPFRQEDIAKLEEMTVAERQEFWKVQFDRCIRCYACRAVCPGCFCTQCFVDSLDPEWVGMRTAPSENRMWHTIRAFHLAGRCVGCNACEQVCPVNIPLSLLNQKMSKEVLDLFDFQAGLEIETAMPLATFKRNENLGVGE
ncbi:4Fe-4S binding protein [Chloroflexota bacterium]